MNYDALVDNVTQIGKRMIEVGGEINRAEALIRYILKRYNAEDINAFAISNQITVSAKFDGKYYTVLKRVEGVNVNFHQLEELNQLSRDLSSGNYNENEIKDMYEAIINEPPYKSRYIILGSILSTAGFAIFFGGTWLDAIVSALLGFIIIISNKYIRAKINGFVHTAVISFITGSIGIGLYYLLHLTPLDQFLNLDKILIGTVMLLIPGMAITNGLRDIFFGDTLSGVMRIIESLITAICIAVGYGIAILAFAKGTTQSPSSEVMWWIVLLSGIVGAIGYALMFHMRWKEIAITLIGITITLGAYLIADIGNNNIYVIVFVAAIVACGFADATARIVKKPAILFLTISVMPLYPGGAIYYTLSYLVKGDMEQFNVNLINTGWKILAISTGVVVSSVIFKYIFNLVNVIKKKLVNKA